MTEEAISKAVALVPAAGKGERLGLGPKAFLRVGDRTILEHVVWVLRQCVPRVLVGVPPDRVKEMRAHFKNKVEVRSGESTRQQTILRLLEHSNEPLILIHDVTRPFASAALIRQVVQAADEYEAAATFISSPVPAGRQRAGFITHVIPRSEFLLPQSPMAFGRHVLQEAYGHAIQGGIEDQTTWELVLRINIAVRIVPGEERNIKITGPFDWEIAQKVIVPSQHRNSLETSPDSTP